MTTAQQIIDAIRAIAPCSRSAWTPKAVNESASIIQQAITEAVDAAVALKDKRVKELEAALRHEIANCVNCEGLGQFKCGKCADDVLHDCKRCAHARDALEAPHEP